MAKKTEKKSSGSGVAVVVDAEGNAVAEIPPGEGLVLEDGWRLESDAEVEADA